MRSRQVAGGGGPVLRKPRATDAPRVWDLIAACPPLERNSLYCNLLQCTDFSDTCILAERQRALVGWISAYRQPGAAATLFVWQVAVREDARGTGLARKMLMTLLQRSGQCQIEYLKTTVTRNNEPSRSLFRSLAERWNAPLRETAGFDRDTHFRGAHASERLIAIGPIPSPIPGPVPADPAGSARQDRGLSGQIS